MTHRILHLSVLLIGLAPTLPTSSADVVSLSGENLTINSRNISVSFKGAEVVRISNLITGEMYFNNVVKLPPLMEMKMLGGEKGPLKCTTWRVGRANDQGIVNGAQTSFSDLDRSVWINVIIDEETQDIVVRIWGDSRSDGLTGLKWGFRGLDLSYGKLIIPAQGGIYLDKQTAPQSSTFSYPTDWEAQMFVWEGKEGGFVTYCRDPDARYRKMQLVRRGDYADLGIETEAVAPWSKANSVPQTEWRINAFKGDWRVPALGYRALMNYNRKPLEATGTREWVKGIRAVLTVEGRRFNSEILNAAAKRLDPKKTLLYLADWRKAERDTDYPNYTPNDEAKAFIEQAHDLGFRVMLHTEMCAVSPHNSYFGKLAEYQAKNPQTGVLAGNHWDRADTDKERYAYINPAARPFRESLFKQLRPVMDELKPDAIHLSRTAPLWNDGSGLIEDQNFIQGATALQRALIDEFPGIVLSCDSINEIFSPYNWFAQCRNLSDLAPHPISAFLFGDRVLSYGRQGLANPDASPTKFLKSFERFECQGVLPTLVVSSAEDFTDDKPEMARLLKVAKSWQDHDLTPTWAGESKSAMFRFAGSDGVLASIEQAGPGIRFKVGDEVVYHRVRGASEIVTSLFLPGWPAFDEGAIFGLDPAKAYWLEAKPRPAGTLHISAMPAGAVLTSTEITRGSGKFEIRSPERTAANLFKIYPNARQGIILEGRDYGIGKGAKTQVTEIVAGNEPRSAIELSPPWQGVFTGSTFVEYDLQVPATGPALSFSVTPADGRNSGGDTLCRVTVDGKELWREHITGNVWAARRIDLGQYAGESVKLRLIVSSLSKTDSEPIGAAWSEIQMVSAREIPSANIKIQLPSGTHPEISTSSGKVETVKDNTTELSQVKLPVSISVRLKPTSVATHK